MGNRMIRVWGRTTSSNVMKVLWLLDELSLGYERVDAGGAFGGTDTPAYRAMNPVGLIPTLEENGFSLFESNAILRYLANAYAPGGDWYPSAPRARATVDAWLDLQQTYLGPPIGTLFWQMVRAAPAKRDMAVVAAALAESAKAWALVDAKLAGQAYLLGAQPTIADIAFAVHVHRWFAMPIERPDLPALRAWYDRLLPRPAYATHVALPLA
jgi:glutathione S-transferase